MFISLVYILLLLLLLLLFNNQLIFLSQAKETRIVMKNKFGKSCSIITCGGLVIFHAGF